MSIPAFSKLRQSRDPSSSKFQIAGELQLDKRRRNTSTLQPFRF